MNEMPRLPPPEERKLLSPPAAPPRRTGGRWWAALLVLLVVAGLVGWGAFSHWSTDERAAQAQQDQANYVPTVRVARAERRDGPVKLVLPGTTLAYDQASLFARATGYVADRKVDIGDRVRRGDLLARIAAPDLDAQLTQAEAQLGQVQAASIQANANVDQARANVNLANRTNFRTSTLAGQGWETKQNADNTAASLTSNTASLESALAGVKVAEANVKAQIATVQRLQQLTEYERIVAPFDGVITARGIDVGDLVTADAGGGTAAFAIQRDDTIRVQAYVPQSGAIGISEGLHVSVKVPEMPDHPFSGEVARSAIALDPSSRTLLVQADVGNPERLLHPGTYVEVTFDIPRQKPGIVVPAEAVLFDASGMHVAVIDHDGVAHMRKVVAYRDFGTAVELSDGLDGGETLALSPPVDLKDGQKVKPQDKASDSGA